MLGEIPFEVDHINGNTFDNSFANLRSCSKSDNQKNRRIDKRNNVNFNGISKFKMTGKWRSRVGVDGKSIHLGLFSTFYAACYARHYANIKYGFHYNHGKEKVI